MRYGFRRPSFRKSFKARTTGRLKRQYKRALNPLYGRKGMGYLHNPRKAIYNGIYHRTTVSPIPRSKTKAYRHAYYMKRKYGYIPNDTNARIDREERAILNNNTEASDFSEDLYSTNWTQKAEQNEKRDHQDNNNSGTETNQHEQGQTKYKQDGNKIKSFNLHAFLASEKFKVWLLKCLNILMYFIPFVPPLLLTSLPSTTQEEDSVVMFLSSFAVAGYALYYEGHKQGNSNFKHLLIYSLILGVCFLLLSL